MTTRDSDSADIAIVGGGIVGGFVAYYLAHSGARVEIIDPEPGAGASAGNAGILALSYCMPMSNPTVLMSGVKSLLGSDPAATLARPLKLRTLTWLAKFALASRPGRAPRDAPRIHELATRSMRLYDDFARAENVDLRFRRTGWLFVARSHDLFDAQLRAAEQLRSLGVQHALLDESALHRAEPGLAPGHVGGIHFTDDVSMDPAALTRSVLDCAVKHGATITRGQVVSVDRTGTRVHAVHINTGRRVTAGQFVIAAGGDSADIGRMFGARIPVERGYGWSLVLPTPSPLAKHALMGVEDHVVINAGADSVRITGGMEFGGRPSKIAPHGRIDHLRESAEKVLPAIGQISDPGQAWRGARPMTPSGLPYTARVGDNLVAVTGHGTLGMTLAPASGKQAAAMLAQAD